MTIGILLVCTGNYWIFLQPLITSIDNLFLTDCDIDVFLFTDRRHELAKSRRINIIHLPIEHKKFPYPTLYRYSFFTDYANAINSDYIYYMDVDMLIIDKIDKEILPDPAEDSGLVATLHPGFYSGGGAWCQDHNSLAYVIRERRDKYFAGGFQGGETKKYLAAAKQMSQNIIKDKSNGITAEWHDESHWNRYLIDKKYKTLSPAYCMVEEQDLRKLWKIDEFKPKIIAMKKSHEEIRDVLKTQKPEAKAPVKINVTKPEIKQHTEGGAAELIYYWPSGLKKRNSLKYGQLVSVEKNVYDTISSILENGGCVKEDIIKEINNFNIPFNIWQKNGKFAVECETFTIPEDGGEVIN